MIILIIVGLKISVNYYHVRLLILMERDIFAEDVSLHLEKKKLSERHLDRKD